MKQKKEIKVIPPDTKYDKSVRVEKKILNVAAYCRVSTRQEQQENSFEAQVNYFAEKIAANPLWNYAGIYLDQGKTATSTKKRDSFNDMLEDCYAGKIDLILKKSISRFVRKFEQGNVRVNHNKFLGYTKDSKGRLVIVPEEAEIVRKIFDLYLSGFGHNKIARILEQEGIKTVTGNVKWHGSVICKMLSNEKYMGDAVLQKAYTVDFLSKKKVINKGIVPQYYVEDDHEPIIPKELFYRVQEEKARRASLYTPAAKRKDTGAKIRYSSTYALSDILTCGECGHPYRRQVWSKYGIKKAVWRCDSHLKNGTKMCRQFPHFTGKHPA